MRTLIALSLLATSLAHADPPRYARKPNLVIDVKLSSRVKPAEPTPPPATKPTVTASAILEAEVATQPIRREQEAILEKLVADTPNDDPDKPDYMFRLAEHYAKQLRFWRLQAVAPTLPPRAR
jgi:hypothetical protein